MNLAALTRTLRSASALHLKRDIQAIASRLPRTVRCGEAHHAEPGVPDAQSQPQSQQGSQRIKPAVRLGDDTAAIPDREGYLLFAAEGILPALLQQDPWFAGFCSVMVNVSDVAAMGGRPIAVVDVVFTGSGLDLGAVLHGMHDAATAFDVPVVGGHTSRIVGESALAVAILGRAERLITSFDARPGHVLLAAVDQRGTYRGVGNNFDAATGASRDRLREALAVLPDLANLGLVTAGRDISMAGWVGTLVMLCEASGCGAVLELDAIRPPLDIPLSRWLVSFPSFGHLLATEPQNVEDVCRRFGDVGIPCAPVGHFTEGTAILLSLGRDQAIYWDLNRESLTGFGPNGGAAA